MTEEDQFTIVTKILQCRRAELSLQQAETQYGESLFLIRQHHLAREKAWKHCSPVDEELQHATSETVKRYMTLRNAPAGASSLHERNNSSECQALLMLVIIIPNTDSYMLL